MSSLRSFFQAGGAAVRLLVGALVLFGAATAFLAPRVASERYRRDLTRMVFNDNLELLDDVKRSVGEVEDTLRQTLVETSGDSPAPNEPYLIVSIADHRVWYKQGNEVLFSTRVATGSGKVLAKGGGNQWKFETPRGRLKVLYKESEPAWVPPDWHFVEVAHKKKLGLKALVRGEAVPIDSAGTVITVSGNNVVKRFADGSEEIIESGEGKEIIADGRVIVPPFGTNQRRYPGVVGTHRLNLGDGYALHGTDVPSSIGQSVSHGCIRLRNEDIETLYRIVPVGTPVFIY